MSAAPSQTSQAALLNRFRAAYQAASLDWLKATLDDGLNPNTQDTVDLGTPHARQRHLLEFVLSPQADEINTELAKAMHKAGFLPKVVTILLEAGSDPRQAVFAEGKTPLMVAMQKEELEIVRLLIAAGDDIEATDHHGMSVAHYACSCRPSDVSMLALLEEHGVNFNPPATRYGQTHLMMLSGRMDDQLEPLIWMLQRTPERINDQDSHGDTALMYAIEAHNLDEIRTLIAHGADVTICNQKGKDALGYARDLSSHAEQKTSDAYKRFCREVVDELEVIVQAQQARNLVKDIATQAHAGGQRSSP